MTQNQLKTIFLKFSFLWAVYQAITTTILVSCLKGRHIHDVATCHHLIDIKNMPLVYLNLRQRFCYVDITWVKQSLFWPVMQFLVESEII